MVSTKSLSFIAAAFASFTSFIQALPGPIRARGLETRVFLPSIARQHSKGEDSKREDLKLAWPPLCNVYGSSNPDNIRKGLNLLKQMTVPESFQAPQGPGGCVSLITYKTDSIWYCNDRPSNVIGVIVNYADILPVVEKLLDECSTKGSTISVRGQVFSEIGDWNVLLRGSVIGLGLRAG